MQKSKEVQNAEEVMQKVFEVLPPLTGAQREILISAGASLYARGASHTAGDLVARLTTTG